MDYYNEIDPYAAQWLRNLIDAGHIAPGWVDTRSIEDVKPNELTEFRRCHFFAGIGGWALALEIAGWPSDRRVWTGSCPCQPFSAAGKGDGFADERHLWPAWQHLIAQCNPPVIFGEQVASKAVDAWIDLVHADMEGMGYAFGSIPYPAAGIGAPHIRDRNYWVAHTGSKRWLGRKGAEDRNVANRDDARRFEGNDGSSRADEAGVRMANSEQHHRGCKTKTADHWKPEVDGPADQYSGYRGSSLRGLAYTEFVGVRGKGLGSTDGSTSRVQGTNWQRERVRPDTGASSSSLAIRANGPGPTNGLWGNADWLRCTDGKWRPVEPSTQQMVDGLSRGMGLLRSDNVAKEEIGHATEAVGLADQVLRALRNGHASQAVWGSLGGRIGLPEATLLLASLCEQSRELGQFFHGAPSGSAPGGEASLRAMQHGAPEAARPSPGRGCAEQLAWELGDALPELSQACSSARQHLDQLRQFTGSPLAKGVSGRVGRLRAYGNAIVPQQAAEFIGAYLDTY